MASVESMKKSSKFNANSTKGDVERKKEERKKRKQIRRQRRLGENHEETNGEG